MLPSETATKQTPERGVGGSERGVVSAAVPGDYDGLSPELLVEPLEFSVGDSIDNTPLSDDGCVSGYHYDIPLVLRWTATDSGSGVKSYDVIKSDDTGPGGTFVAESAIQETSLEIRGTDARGCGGGGYGVLRAVRVRDHAGNTATSRLLPKETPYVWQEDGIVNGAAQPIPTARVGNWRVGQCSCFDGDRTLFSVKGGNSLSYQLDTEAGQVAAVVMEKNSNRGSVGIRVNGGPPTTVDTYSAQPQHRVIVWQTPLPEGTNEVKIINQGIPGRLRVDVDAVMLIGSARGEVPPFEIP